jgi:hypothetical protein
MRIIAVASVPVKPTRVAPCIAAPFGAGLFRFSAYAVTAAGFREPSDEDRAACGSLFADAPDYDQRAAESAFLASIETTDPTMPVGIGRRIS